MPALTKNQLRERGIYNSHNFCTAGGGKLFIVYHPRGDARSVSCAKWVVAGLNFATDPKAAWYDHGCKTFIPMGKDRVQVGEEAKAWASEKYGITEWKRDPFGGWQDAKVWAAVMGGPK